MCHTVASNWEACMWKYVSFTAGCCRTVFFFFLKSSRSSAFSSAYRMISRLVWSWEWDPRITKSAWIAMCRGHTRPEMDVEKARLIHQCSGRSKRWRYETASRGSRAFTAPALESLGSWLTLSCCWGGRADTETINTLCNPAKTHISRITMKFLLLQAFLISLSPPTPSPERHSNGRLQCFPQLIMKMLFCLHVQTATWLAVSASNSDSSP